MVGPMVRDARCGSVTAPAGRSIKRYADPTRLGDRRGKRAIRQDRLGYCADAADRGLGRRQRRRPRAFARRVKQGQSPVAKTIRPVAPDRSRAASGPAPPSPAPRAAGLRSGNARVPRPVGSTRIEPMAATESRPHSAGGRSGILPLSCFHNAAGSRVYRVPPIGGWPTRRMFMPHSFNR